MVLVYDCHFDVSPVTVLILIPSPSEWKVTVFHRVFPDGMVENYPGFPPPQDSPSVSSMEVKTYICN